MIVQHQNVSKVKLVPFEICYLNALHISQFHDTCKYLLISCHLLYKLATPVQLISFDKIQQPACGIYIYVK